MRFSISLVALFAAGSMALPATTEQTCPSDRVWNDCGSACPKKCNQEPGFCIQVCVPGCFCKEGTILNAEGSCVKPEDCPAA